MRQITEVAEDIKNVLNEAERTENGDCLTDINELVDEILVINTVDASAKKHTAKKDAFQYLFNWVISIIFVIGLIAIIMLSTAIEEVKQQRDDLRAAMYYTEELDKCPMCNAEVKLLGTESFYIECDKYDDRNGCGLKTGYYKSKETLIQEWNNIQR